MKCRGKSGILLHQPDTKYKQLQLFILVYLLTLIINTRNIFFTSTHLSMLVLFAMLKHVKARKNPLTTAFFQTE